MKTFIKKSKTEGTYFRVCTIELKWSRQSGNDTRTDKYPSVTEEKTTKQTYTNSIPNRSDITYQWGKDAPFGKWGQFSLGEKNQFLPQPTQKNKIHMHLKN